MDDKTESAESRVCGWTSVLAWTEVLGLSNGLIVVMRLTDSDF